MLGAVADDLGVGQHRVESELQVRMVGRRQLGDRRREPAGIGAEVLAQPLGQRRLRSRRRLAHRVHEVLERGAERPGIRQLPCHGTGR
jgi:hypothetical protein